MYSFYRMSLLILNKYIMYLTKIKFKKINLTIFKKNHIFENMNKKILNYRFSKMKKTI